MSRAAAACAAGAQPLDLTDVSSLTSTEARVIRASSSSSPAIASAERCGWVWTPKADRVSQPRRSKAWQCLERREKRRISPFKPLAESSRDGRPLGDGRHGHESLELAADELLLALVELDDGLTLRCLARCGDEADPLGLELGLSPLALPLLTLVLRSAHAVPPFACARTR